MGRFECRDDEGRAGVWVGIGNPESPARVIQEICQISSHEFARSLQVDFEGNNTL